MNNKYSISHISRLRMETDGDGIRDLIVTANCPLQCKYCINPYTWNQDQILQQLTAKEIYERIKIDTLYMLETNGGVTIGGGEPLLQPEIFEDLKRFYPLEITFYTETSFYVPYKNIQKAEKYIDRFYVDIKSMDEYIYKQYCGGELCFVVDNLSRFIKEYGAEKIVVRVPVIPDYTDEKDQREAVTKLKKMGIHEFDLFQYVNISEIL